MSSAVDEVRRKISALEAASYLVPETLGTAEHPVNAVSLAHQVKGKLPIANLDTETIVDALKAMADALEKIERRSEGS
jgi:hypothetical protein